MTSYLGESFHKFLGPDPQWFLLEMGLTPELWVITALVSSLAVRNMAWGWTYPAERERGPTHPKLLTHLLNNPGSLLTVDPLHTLYLLSRTAFSPVLSLANSHSSFKKQSCLLGEAFTASLELAYSSHCHILLFVTASLLNSSKLITSCSSFDIQLLANNIVLNKYLMDG